ncbi:MAG TPA: glycosyltransferase family 4 protein [Verrucomicrobiae bacterium]|nr:glycosyltransferase family 4 protein [Verrucomicrobiae bacterium]
MKIAILTTDSREHFGDYANPKPYFGAAPEALLQGFILLPEIKVHVVSCLQRPANSPEKLADNIWFHSLHVPKIGWMRTGYQGCIRAVRKKLKEIQPDIVHGQGTERDCAISAVFSRFPNIVTVHGKMAELARLFHARVGTFSWLAGKLEDFTLAQTQGVICISDYVEKLVRDYGVSTWLVPNAIQKMFFDYPRTGQPTGTKPLLVNVGVISERKRQHKLLPMLESLRAEGLQFDTLFIGVAPAGSAYAVEFLATLEQANRTHGGFEHITRLDDEAFCQLYDRASAMIHFSSEESFGLTFGEAIARGLYLFASDVGAVRDMARGVERAQIFDLNDWDGLKKSIRQWLVSGGDRLPRPASPPLEFVQHYHPKSVAQRHLEIYREVLNTRS